MNIAEAARRSGLNAKTIRYYEQIGLVAPAERRDNGYRRFDRAALAELQFLAHARRVGFDLPECRQLLELLRNPTRRSRHARELVLAKHRQLQARVEELQAVQAMLLHLAERCRGDEGPECGILEELVAADGAAP